MAQYLDAYDFTFELTICKGRGKVSPRLSNMFWLIANNLKSKNVFFIQEFHDDQVMEAYTRMMETWNCVELDKFEPNQIFAYFSERCKRSYTQIYNLYLDRHQRNNFKTIPKVSLSSFDYFNSF